MTLRPALRTPLLSATAALGLLCQAPFTHAADAAPAADPARLSAHVKTLSSDAFEGRGPSTAGEQKTVAYLTEQMKAAGLQPGGDLRNGTRSWTQDVPLAQFDIKGPVAISITADGQNQPLAQGKDVAVRAAATNVDRVRIKDAPLVFLGYGVTAPERQWDDYQGIDMRGKVAIVLINDPDFETGAGDFGGRAMTYYGRWTYKYEEAARHGALGVLIVHETAPASYGWATLESSNTNTIFDILRKDPRSEHVDLEAWIQRDVAVNILKKAGLDFDHVTGHGVGVYLSVHEGPQRISKLGTTPLEAGMILSNEPGYYKAGAYGIRIENLLLVTPVEPVEGGERPMHGFETLTFAPIDRRLIEPSLLAPADRAWLDGYHGEVMRRIGPLVDEDTRAWLAAATAPL